MSDLYLDLKRRIPVVGDWTTVGSEEMDRAQRKLGLSDEKLAAELHIVSKTWSRWKKRGQIPTHELRRVAPILGFEMVSVDPMPLAVSESTPLLAHDLRQSLATVIDLLRAMAETGERVESALLRIEQAMPEPVARPKRAHQARTRS